LELETTHTLFQEITLARGVFRHEVTSARKEPPIEGTASASVGAVLSGRKRKEPPKSSVNQPGYVDFALRCINIILLYFFPMLQQQLECQ
jgi:hypothetical protein